MSRFIGCGTALATPFKADGSFDEATMRKLVERQITEGIDFLVPCGTTGESPTLEHHEHLRVVEVTCELANGRVPILAGAGGYDTRHIIHLIKDLEKLGVDGILSVTPYYNKPTQDGVIAHFEAIAAATQLPIILYSVQPRTNVNMEPATVERLSRIDNVVGIKEASGSLAQVASIANRVDPDFDILSGDDSVTIPVVALGGKGLISVASNEIPAQMTALTRAALENNFAEARRIQRHYQPLLEVNFIEASPQPLKAAMEMMGLLENNLRLPLVRSKPEIATKVRNVLVQVGLLPSTGIEDPTHALHGTVVA